MRRRLTRDVGLSIRITAVTFVLVAMLGAGLALAALLPALDPGASGAWCALLALVLLPAAVILSAPWRTLRSAGARRVKPGRHVQLVESLERLSALAGAPVPRLAISQSRVPNAFTVGLTRRRSTIVVTRRLLRELEPAEIDAVLAHELVHVANRDALLLTAAGVIPLTGAFIGHWQFAGHDPSRRFREQDPLRAALMKVTLWPLAVVLYPIGSVLVLAVSRYREFVADRGAALLTGAPEHLMSALVKLSQAGQQIPERDLRSFSVCAAFCIVSRETEHGFFGADHPPLEKRLEALAEIARQLGRPV